MKRISHIGLDMDHTLVRYNSTNFEKLTHKIMLDKLVSVKDYPADIKSLEFNWDTSIRGLVIDKNKGNLLKLSRFGGIRMSQHGLSKIDYSTQLKIYKSTYIDLGEPEYDTIDTYFSIAFACLFAQLVDFKDNHKVGKLLPEYPTIADDLNSVLDSAHRDGSIKSLVADDLPHFIVKDEEIVKGLLRFLKHDKKIFVVTNSDFEYTKLLMDYAINPFLPDGKTWLDLFEVVITAAKKPRFFYDNLNFLKINPENGVMTNLGPKKVTAGVYQGGGAQQFTSDLGLEPDQILYVGDHIYGDILRLKKDCAWRTALVVEEIEEEVQKTQESLPISRKIEEMMSKKIPLEQKLDILISQKIEQDGQGPQKEIDDLMAEVNEIDQEISPLINKLNQYYNPYWGELMRTGIEESYFAYQVERFACIYMSRLSNLLNLSPRTYFRSRKRSLAHDPEL